MESLALDGGYRLTVAEMSRRSQLAISTWFNEWFAGGGSQAAKLQTVSAISTQVILHSRVSLYRDNEKLADGTYELEEGVSITLPLTEVTLNDLPASLVAWLINAAGKENATVLEGFLAAVRVTTARGTRTYARLSDSGHSSKSTPH